MTYSFPKLLETLTAGGRAGQALVLATIVETDGSTPQVVGASAVFSGAGLVSGTVGGGLLEARVGAAAAKALADREPRLLAVRLDADPSDQEGAICGGTARVLIDPGVDAARGVFESAVEGFRKRRRGSLVSRIVPGHGETVAVERGWLPAGAPVLPDDPVFGDVAPEVLGEGLATGRPRLVGTKDRMWFIEPVLPLPRLIIAGAGHVGRAVARLGSLLDFSVTIVDDRAEFANAAHVPEADEIIVGEFSRAIREIEDSPDDYFVVVTRGHQKDAEALRAAIGREAAYVGMIGSKRKIELMQCEFLESGWATAERWAWIHAPIGVDIGSRTVEEIAVSIAAELVLVRSRRAETVRP
ncbi:MAG TPA: XdhC family protein [Acidobacteriota bacterium]|nr:XdhC family protein [Acidobacteriota bacterium]